MSTPRHEVPESGERSSAAGRWQSSTLIGLMRTTIPYQRRKPFLAAGGTAGDMVGYPAGPRRKRASAWL